MTMVGGASDKTSFRVRRRLQIIFMIIACVGCDSPTPTQPVADSENMLKIRIGEIPAKQIIDHVECSKALVELFLQQEDRLFLVGRIEIADGHPTSVTGFVTDTKFFGSDYKAMMVSAVEPQEIERCSIETVDGLTRVKCVNARRNPRFDAGPTYVDFQFSYRCSE